MGGPREKGGLAISRLFVGWGASDHEAGTTAAGLGAVEGGVESDDELRIDLLAQVGRGNGARNKVLVGADLVRQAADGVVRVTLIDGPVRGVPRQDPVVMVSDECPSGSMSESVMGLTEHHEVVRAGGPALAPGGEVIGVVAGSWSLTGGGGTCLVAGSYGVYKSR